MLSLKIIREEHERVCIEEETDKTRLITSANEPDLVQGITCHSPKQL